MNEEAWMKLAASLPELILQFGALGVPGWIAAGVLTVGVLVGGYLIHRWIEGKRQERSDGENADRRDDSQAGLPGLVSELEQGLREGGAWIRERIAQRMAKDLEERIIRVEVDAPVKPYGTVSGWPRGAVVHYTAGRECLDPAEAKRQIEVMCKNGVAAFLIGTDGRIYAPRNLGWKDQHAHAGKSIWRGTQNVSTVCFGIEIACAGKLDPDRKSWFGNTYSEDEVRHTPGKENQIFGVYHRYTPAQEKALVDLLSWHLKYNPEFSVDWVVGHDEVAPDRKTDPGASLSVTMPELRRMLAEIRAAQ